MPVVNVSWCVKAKKEEKKAFMDFTIDTIHRLSNTDKSRISVFINNFEAENAAKPDCPVIHINWVALPGRDNEVRKQIIQELTEKISEFPGVDKSGVTVIINDAPVGSGAIGMGKPAE